MTCVRIQERLVAVVSGERIDDSAAREALEHIGTCQACRTALVDYVALDGRLRAHALRSCDASRSFAAQDVAPAETTSADAPPVRTPRGGDGEARESPQRVWEQVLRALGRKAARPSFESSLKQVRPRALVDDRLELVVATAFARDWLEKRGTKALEAAATEVLDRPVTVRLELAQMDLGLDVTAAVHAPRTSSRRRRD